MKRSMLSTIDNPFNPFDDFKAWYAYDVSSGYYTCELLARIAMTSDELSEADQDLAVDNAINEILKENISGMFIKVEREFADNNFAM